MLPGGEHLLYVGGTLDLAEPLTRMGSRLSRTDPFW